VLITGAGAGWGKSMKAEIKFGTSGWRAIIADEFTLENVRRAVTGIARYVVAQNSSRRQLIIARDPRFLGETLVGVAAEIVSAHGITPFVIAEPAPTPAISYEVIRTRSDGAINFTASHNPPLYNGIKFSTSDGAPALPEVTQAIEAEIASADREEAVPRGERKEQRTIDVRASYTGRLKEIIDLDAIRKAHLKVAYDPLWGCGRGYPDAVLCEAGAQVETVHDYRDVLFGGNAPEPSDRLLGDLRARMREMGASIGIATDGDADRFGIVDGDGTFIQPNYVVALLFDYLVESRCWRNGVCKSVATTNLINALAQHHGIELYETPVGFKYIGELIKQDKIVIGGEESAGLSIRYHVPEKDGILACLLCCEMVARRGKPIMQQLHELFAKVGSFYPTRENFRLTPEVREKFTTKLQGFTAAKPHADAGGGTGDVREFAGRRVAEVNIKDGLKLIFEDGSWVCYRLSGTEPVVRIYTEARSREDLEKLSAAARQWIFE
jgi:alpha-D-glucose phosphate-specific phosphoglucomutase